MGSVNWDALSYETPDLPTFDERIMENVKKSLGIETTYEIFDQDILIHMNSVVSILDQLGAGPVPRRMLDTSTTWDEYGIDDPMLLGMIKTYMCLKVRQMFDPPTGAAAEAATRLISELEWRINVEAERKCQADGGEVSGP